MLTFCLLIVWFDFYDADTIDDSADFFASFSFTWLLLQILFPFVASQHTIKSVGKSAGSHHAFPIYGLFFDIFWLSSLVYFISDTKTRAYTSLDSIPTTI